MNGNSIVGSLYKVKGGREVSLNDLNHEPEILKRVYDINYVVKLNSGYQGTRKFIKIDFAETLKMQKENGNKQSFDLFKKNILELKKKELYRLKKSIGFSTKDSYSEAVEMGEESGAKGRDYIIAVENELEDLEEALKSFEGETKEEEPKRKRRTKAEIEADKEKEDLND